MRPQSLPPQRRYNPRPDLNRIPEITTRFGGRPAEVPQAYHDFIASDADTCCNAVDDLGPYSHSSVADGDWSNPATWDAGTVPGVGAVVNVGHAVTYDVESDAKVKDINVEEAGTLRWATDRDTRLWVDTLLAYDNMIIGDGANPIPESTTPGKPRAEIVIHSTEAPGSTVRQGIVCKGASRAVGAEKASRLFSPRDIPAGSVAVTLDGVVGANWRKGDRIVIGATCNAGTSATDPQYTGPTQFYGPYQGVNGVRMQTEGFRLSHDELRTIVAIVGNTLVLDAPLQHAHVVTTRRLKRGQVRTRRPVVAMLSHSIRIRSEDPSSLQTRGHTMNMHHDDCQWWYVEFKDIGRTDTDPSLVNPDGTLARATNGGTVITNPNNVRGRYPIHLHWQGPYFGRKQSVVKGCSVWGENYPIPGWAITHHASRAAIEDCVVYNVRGAGIVSELGNEIGQWLNNTVMWCRGDGFAMSWGSRAELWQNHNGHAGVAYESQSRAILQQGNIATSSQDGWGFMQQNVDQLNRIPHQFSMRYQDPLASGKGSGSQNPVFFQDEETYGIEQAQIVDFHDNACYGCGVGFFIAHRQFTERTDNSPMISKGFDCIATERPFNLINYSFWYSFHDFLWTGPGFGTATRLGPVSWGMNFVNGHIEGFDIGFDEAGLGFNYAGFFIDLTFEDVPTEFTHFTGDFDIAEWEAENPGMTFPQDHSYYNLMGPWETDAQVSVPGERWAGILRRYQNLDSATDLPQAYPASPIGVDGVEPLPGTPKPYFYLDPTSDTSLGTTGIVSIKATISDAVGSRTAFTWVSSESFGPDKNARIIPNSRANGNTLENLVKRNGCYQDGGIWKTRCWFVDQDRLSGDYFQYPVDLVHHSSTDAGLLAANVVPPWMRPELPLRPEALGEPAAAP
ncbi:hypothetical protein J8F10_08895 [Gemmata sp. G18]|uniref:G8 domain-containing protein n=1 Tax=Gemmata palustris TaxID=2822762 RepID=A0ABS5BNU9_9BACT|nr:hypothetical protein [Gemmata palustris]MBP3955396.1 hypothetical protein [Gemmata palustris]